MDSLVLCRMRRRGPFGCTVLAVFWQSASPPRCDVHTVGRRTPRPRMAFTCLPPGKLRAVPALQPAPCPRGADSSFRVCSRAHPTLATLTVTPNHDTWGGARATARRIRQVTHSCTTWRRSIQLPAVEGTVPAMLVAGFQRTGGIQHLATAARIIVPTNAFAAPTPHFPWGKLLNTRRLDSSCHGGLCAEGGSRGPAARRAAAPRRVTAAGGGAPHAA